MTNEEVTPSVAINEAIAKAILAGNEVKETCSTWSKMRLVVYMRDRLSDSLRSDLQSYKRLQYAISNYDRHYPAEEDFIDDDKKVSISFPTDYITYEEYRLMYPDKS